MRHRPAEGGSQPCREWRRRCGERCRAQFAISVSVASGHAWGTCLLQPGFGTDREPGEASGEVSASPSLAMAGVKHLLVPASMEQLLGALAPRTPTLAIGGARAVLGDLGALPSCSRHLLPPPRSSQPPHRHLRGHLAGWGFGTVTAWGLPPPRWHCGHLSVGTWSQRSAPRARPRGWSRPCCSRT